MSQRAATFPQTPRASRTLSRRWLRGLLLAACCGCTFGPASAQVTEYAVKAAFVFNFAVFTEWPAEALPGGAPLQLCAYPGNAMQGALAALGDKQVNGHRVQLRQPGSGAAARACNILFLDGQDRERWNSLRPELAGASVLTVADDRVIGAGGAVLALAMDHARVVFDADLAAARQARLTISSKLLRLARSVQ
ncbi:YfiR family protein [Duganella sp. LX20W]|uniref:YfiR family protein n=1 Tax=Rugamonas brunnea TaxID=2758569 RepID=A0A7W2IBQ3_9BURK|nr:YfiR family protein [Rugamonas brunnea]MBA5637544.1 YfiR family protein [Rugamonas brunnea]